VLGLLASSALAEGTHHSQESVAGYAMQAPPVSREEPVEQVRVLPGGAKLHLARGTVLKLLRPTRLPLYPGKPATPAQVVQLSSGSVRVVIPKTSGVAVLVRAPRSVSAVIKSGAGVVVANDEALTVAAFEGDMLAAVGDKWRPLNEGFARSFHVADATGKPRRIVGVPGLDSAAAVALAPGGAGSHRVSWSAVPGAAAYRVRIVDATRATPARELETSELAAQFTGLDAGRYELLLAAKDAYGLEGPAARGEVDMLGLELPAGARVVGNDIELGMRHRLRFSDSTGLELSYGSAAPFVAAPSDVGVVNRGPTLVRVRRSGEAAELSFRLLPRDVRAEVDLAPVLALWPRDAVTIRIALRDGQGRRLTPGANLRPEVSVNLDPVAVSWTRRGDVLEATLPPRADKGPWVVRVQVRDEHGEEIGWGSLEVAPL
jgi:hypothetical protein